MDSKYKNRLLYILVIYLLINIYVSFLQKKILIIGDWPHDLFKVFYGSLGIAFAWSPSISFADMDKNADNSDFDIVVLDVSPSDVDSSIKNIDIIKKLSINSKIYWVTNEFAYANYIKNKNDLDLYIVNRNVNNIYDIINGAENI